MRKKNYFFQVSTPQDTINSLANVDDVLKICVNKQK